MINIRREDMRPVYNRSGTDPPPKKISGHQLGALFGESVRGYTPLDIWLDIMGGHYGCSFDPSASMGLKVEADIIHRLRDAGFSVVTPGVEEALTFDSFPDCSFFGGTYDGLLKEDGKCEILEIKTHTDPEQWQTPPIEYITQALAYAYFCGAEKAKIIAYRLTTKEEEVGEYRYDPRRVKCWEYLTKESDIEQKINYAKNWYKEYILTGVGPALKSEKEIKKIINFNKKNEKLRTEEINNILHELSIIKKKINDANRVFDIDNLQKKESKLLKKLKTLVDNPDFLSCIFSVGDDQLKISKDQPATVIDKKQLKEEFPDIYRKVQKEKASTIKARWLS